MERNGGEWNGGEWSGMEERRSGGGEEWSGVEESGLGILDCGSKILGARFNGYGVYTEGIITSDEAMFD